MSTRWLVPSALIAAFTTAIAMGVMEDPKTPADPPAPEAPAGKATFKNEWFFDGNKPDLLGKPAPELEVSDWYGGEATTIKDLKGQIVVVDFWGTWCPPCRKAVPHTTEMAEKYKDKGVRIIGVHSTKAGEKMQATAKQLKMGYPTARDVSQKSENSYKVQFWPFYVLVDREGVVRAAGLNPSYLGNAIDELLKEQPAKAAS